MGIGSSPRLRGTLSPGDAGRHCHRFIPAFAGNAAGPRKTMRPLTVHPRVCGERPDAPEAAGVNSGSSPRLREREYARDGDRLWNGSSPRLRGTLLALVKYDLAARFIPAFAGNACFRSRSGSLCPVHPRVCGERDQPAGSRSLLIGSSPRLRGTRARQQCRQYGHRFIPAFAGNAVRPDPTMTWSSVHPRVCGERTNKKTPLHTHTGSSPRLRGTHGRYELAKDVCRFIPAFAGNARSPPAELHTLPVHPRVCGERVFR